MADLQSGGGGGFAREWQRFRGSDHTSDHSRSSRPGSRSGGRGLVEPAPGGPSRHPRDGAGEPLSPRGGAKLRTDRPHKPTRFCPRAWLRNPTRFFPAEGRLKSVGLPPQQTPWFPSVYAWPKMENADWHGGWGPPQNCRLPKTPSRLRTNICRVSKKTRGLAAASPVPGGATRGSSAASRGHPCGCRTSATGTPPPETSQSRSRYLGPPARHPCRHETARAS